MSWKRMSRWVRSLRPTRRMAPPPPDPERLDAARQAAIRAQQQLRMARERVSAVNASADASREIHTRNNLGPAVMRALHPGA